MGVSPTPKRRSPQGGSWQHRRVVITHRRFWVLALLVVLFWGGTTQPAAAQTNVDDVTTPVDGFYQPGKPVVLLVSVTADRAITGTIIVEVEGQDLTVAQAIEVAGGSTKTFAIPVELPPSVGGVQVVVRTSEGETRRTRPMLGAAAIAEPVVVMPSLAVAGIADRVDLVAENRLGTVVLFDPANLDLGVMALNGASAVFAAPADLAGLSETQLDTLRAWVAAGGRLVVDGSTGDVPAALNDLDFVDQSGAGPIAARAWWGSGSVLLSGDNLANGRLDGLITPRFTASDTEGPIEGQLDTGALLEDLAGDAGFRARPIGLFVAVLLAYIAAVGPVSWLVLSRRRREPLVWVVVPALAAVASLGVWATGRFFQQDSTGSQVTVVGDIAGSSFVDTTYLLSSAGGGTTGIELADGWRPSGTGFDPWDWRVQRANLPPLDVDGRRLAADVPPAGLVLASAVREDVAADTSSWTVDGSYVGGRFQGTAVNETGVDLTEVVLFSGGSFHPLDDVAAGESVSFDAAAGLGDGASMDGALIRQFSRPGGRGSAESPTAVLRWLNRHGDLSSGNFIVGWSGGEAPPLDVVGGGDGAVAGRTAYLTMVSPPVDAEAMASLGAGSPVPARVSVTDVRWSGQAGARVIGRARGDFNEGQTMTATIELPPGFDPETPLRVRVATETVALDVWNGTEWVDSGLGDEEPGTNAELDLPAGAVEDGLVRVRTLGDYPFTTPTLVTAGEAG